MTLGDIEDLIDRVEKGLDAPFVVKMTDLKELCHAARALLNTAALAASVPEVKAALRELGGLS